MATALTDCEKMEILFQVADALNAYKASALCTILGCRDSDRGDLKGCATLLAEGEDSFILTAGHVAKAVFDPDEYKIAAHSTGHGTRPVKFQVPPFVVEEPSDLGFVKVAKGARFAEGGRLVASAMTRWLRTFISSWKTSSRNSA